MALVKVSFRIDGKDYKVKNCPFCRNGLLRLVTHEKDGLQTFRDKYSVLCDYGFGGCGAEGGWRSTPEEAIDCWNTRRRKWKDA